LFNLALIGAMIALLGLRLDAIDAALAIAATVGIAGLLQLFILAMRGGGAATPLRISFDDEMRGFFRKAIPGMIASAGPQWLVVAGAIIASSSPSAVSWLYFANRLIELPLGIVGVAMGTVLVPELTRALRSDDRSAASQAESRGLELAVGLALPATLGLIVLSAPVVRMLFEHGLFTAADTLGTAHALMLLALGLPAHVLVKALSPAFFARDDTFTPLMATLTGFVIAMVVGIVLGHIYGVSGIAAGIVLGAWACAFILTRGIAAGFGFSIDDACRRRLPRIGVAALAMGGSLWAATRVVLAPNAEIHGLALAAALLVLIIGGILIYGALLSLLGVTGWRQALNAIRQTPPSDLRA
jgi:putative peptidoglycan lipid II flippase